jgi:phosphoribosylanthranilate isomerase
MTHTRIKICGLTRAQDIDAAVDAGADAIGLVFYPPSARNVTLDQAAALARRVPAFVTKVGLFVNPTDDEVLQATQDCGLHLLQLHGDETAERCAAIGQLAQRPWMKAFGVGAQTVARRLLESTQAYTDASAWLFDTASSGYGGSGHTFDWSILAQCQAAHIHADHVPPLVLSGGLNAQNVTDAIELLRPYAVDVSSGVESAKGIKDAARIRAFVAAVRQADTQH